MGDQRTSEAEKVDLGQGSREEQQGGPEAGKESPDKGKAGKPGEEKAPPIAPRPSR
jgi:hypothetical protein